VKNVSSASIFKVLQGRTKFVKL